jgi:hypothetical protein
VDLVEMPSQSLAWATEHARRQQESCFTSTLAWSATSSQIAISCLMKLAKACGELLTVGIACFSPAASRFPGLSAPSRSLRQVSRGAGREPSNTQAGSFPVQFKAQLWATFHKLGAARYHRAIEARHTGG